MKKIKLYGIGNFEKYNHYIFDKKQEVIEILFEILGEVFGEDLAIWEEFKDKKGRIKRGKINFEKRFDDHTSSISNNYKIDIFYGKKKMFLAIYCSQKLREKFDKELSKVSLMPKIKKSEKWKNAS